MWELAADASANLASNVMVVDGYNSFEYSPPFGPQKVTNGRSFGLRITHLGTSARAVCDLVDIKQPSQDLRWLTSACAYGPESFEQKTITETALAMERMMGNESFEDLGLIFRSLPVESLSAQVLITLLRVTSTAKSRIPNWSRLLSRVRVSLEIRGLNGAKLLRNL